MKAYIITTSDNRGRQADLTHYPSMLPTPELFVGVSPETFDVPEWWLEIYSKKWKNDNPARVFCCAKSKELLLRQHLERYPDEDALLMEDDVMFTPDASAKYEQFIAAVPDCWKMLYLGGKHEFSCRGMYPMEVQTGILRCKNVLGTEAFIVRSDFIETVIDALTNSQDNLFGHCDWQLVTLQQRNYCFAPLGFIAGQQDGYSLLFNRFRPVGFRNDFYYKDICGVIRAHGNPLNNCDSCKNKCY